MSKVIVRKIQKGKWEDYCTKINASNPISKIWNIINPNAPADAITCCLKTQNNEISVWIVEEDKIDEALLALSTGSKLSDVGTIDYLALSPELLKRFGLTYHPSTDDADTAVNSLKQFHYDIYNLNYKKLGAIQKLIVRLIIHNKVRRKTRGDLLPIVEKAIHENRIDFSILSEEFVSMLKKRKNLTLPDGI